MLFYLLLLLFKSGVHIFPVCVTRLGKCVKVYSYWFVAVIGVSEAS